MRKNGLKKMITDVFKTFFKKEFDRFFVKNKLKTPQVLSEKEIKSFSNYLKRHKKYRDDWEFFENKTRTLFYYNNQNTENLIKTMKKEVKNKAKEIDTLHRLYIEDLLENNQKSYFMITIFPKTQSSILDGVDKIIQARQEATNVLKEYFRYRKIKFNYINIPEISKKEKVHLHMYYYLEISDEQMEEIEKLIQKKLQREYTNEEYDVHIKKFDINYKFAKNYSSFEKNLLEKMGKMPKHARIIYFFLFKMFGKRRFLTHSKVLSFKYLRRTMAFLGKEGIRISYYKLIEKILSNDNKIKVYVGNKRVTLSVVYKLSKDISLLFPD